MFPLAFRSAACVYEEVDPVRFCFTWQLYGACELNLHRNGD